MSIDDCMDQSRNFTVTKSTDHGKVESHHQTLNGAKAAADKAASSHTGKVSISDHRGNHVRHGETRR